MNRIENYLAACGLRIVHGDGKHLPDCIAMHEGKIVQWGHEPTLSLIQSILDLSDRVEELQDELRSR